MYIYTYKCNCFSKGRLWSIAITEPFKSVCHPVFLDQDLAPRKLHRFYSGHDWEASASGNRHRCGGGDLVTAATRPPWMLSWILPQCLRNFCHDEKTACLANLWIVLTMIDCRLGGCSGSDIDITGMALPKTSRPWNEWDKLNYYQRVKFGKGIYISQNVLPQLTPHAPELLEDVLTLCKEIKAMISVSSQ